MVLEPKCGESNVGCGHPTVKRGRFHSGGVDESYDKVNARAPIQSARI
jgi:hypothetical protein